MDHPLKPQHIALVGFMGAGKSTVGPLLADALGRTFVDLDDIILRRSGAASIADLFAQHGETTFRAQERAALQEALADARPLVIATGGGAFMDDSSRKSLLTQAKCLFLATSLATVLTRLGGAEGLATRPLLQGPQAGASAQRLYQDRQSIYAQCPIHVQTDHLTAQEVCAAALQALGGQISHHGEMPTTGGHALLQVSTSTGSYPVELRQQAGEWLATACAAAGTTNRFAIITDTHVAPLHGQAMQAQLQAIGKRVSLHTFAAGEQSKELGTAASLYDELLEGGIGRHDTLVALGGGVVGDLTGFVASTYMRGIPYVQVPTTTLAAVDSSVGGKTAVNTPRGKNLVGTFFPPKAVLIAVSHLATQSAKGHAAGLVESVKMAATHDAALLQQIQRDAAALLAFDAHALLQVLWQSISIKAGVVSRDEREAGERATLNFGHTLGHAIEIGEKYRLQHGESVGLGMLAEVEWAVVAEHCPKSVHGAIEAALLALNMPIAWRRATLDVSALGLDKKRLGSDILLTIVPQLGTFALRPVPLRALVDFVAPRE